MNTQVTGAAVLLDLPRKQEEQPSVPEGMSHGNVGQVRFSGYQQCLSSTPSPPLVSRGGLAPWGGSGVSAVRGELGLRARLLQIALRV